MERRRLYDTLADMRIAVTGASGRIGGHVVDLLTAAGDHEVIGLTRSDADYTDPEALASAFRKVDTLVFVSGDGEAEKVMLHHANVVAAADHAGVGHVVALSGLDADLASPFCYAVTNGYTEHLLRRSSCGFTFARASIHTEFFAQWLRAARASGELRVPSGSGRVSLVSRGDVARSLAALAVAAPVGGPVAVTGPAALTAAAMARTAAETWQVRIRHVDVTPAEFAQGQAADALDPWWMHAYASMFASVRDDRWATVSDDVQRLTRRPAEPLAQFLVELPA